MVKGTTIILGILLALGMASVDAEAYRWVDVQGRVHYGDRPPAGSTTELMSFVDNHGNQAQPGLREGELQMLQTAGQRPTRTARTSGSAATPGSGVAGGQHNCEQARDDLAQVRSEMRAGYRASRYEVLRQREETAKRDLREHCR
jgi:hypothetical protein